MIKSKRKKYIFSFLLSFVLSFITTLFVSAQNKLEVDYPGFQPVTQNILPEYIKYIFTFIIMGAGIWALWYLVEAGIRFLISMGKPERMKQAKSQIFSALLGIFLLLSSYLILNTINPQLVTINPISLTPPVFTLNPPSFSSTPYPNLWWRITEIAQNTKAKTEEIKTVSEELKTKTNNCNCQNTISLCLCEQYYTGCKASACYIGENSHPCPDEQAIKENQQKIIALASEIAYYKNRAENEREDLLNEIKDITDKTIPYYNEVIKSEQEYLNKLPQNSSIAVIQKEEIERLEQKKQELEQKKDLKTKLAESLEKLMQEIDKISPEIQIISQKVLECEDPGVKNKCKPKCTLVGDNDPIITGCHNSNACLPEKCSGGNPCSITEIENAKNKILEFNSTIASASDEIINNVNEIIKFNENK